MTAVLLVVVGAVIRTGVMAGVLGLWGVSLFAFTLVGYGAYQVWYGSGF